jgi:general secretion pathway protein K
MRLRGKDRGAALLMVLWVFAVVSVLAGEFARAMREEAQSTLNYKRETIAHYTAIAGLNEALLTVVTYNGKIDSEESDAIGENDMDEEFRDRALSDVRKLVRGGGDWVKARFDDQAYEVRVQDETGKISLNSDALDEENLSIILENLGFDDETAAIVAASILDWRDDDDLSRSEGAESDYYESVPKPYPAKDAPFDSVDELIFVRGVSRQAFYGDSEFPGLREVFTAMHTSSRINLSAASEAVELALCGESLLDDEERDEFGPNKDERLADLSECLHDLNLRESRSSGRARARLNQALVEARVVENGEGGQRDRTVTQIGIAVAFTEDGFQTLRWYDSIFSEESR